MKKRAFIYIIIAGIMWGTSGIFVKTLSPYGFTSFQLTSLRGIVSFVCIAVFLALTKRDMFKAKPSDLILYAISGIMLFSTSGFYFTSMQMTSISTAVVLMYTAPVLVMIFSVLFLKEKFTSLKLISVICMMLGCLLVSGVIGSLTLNIKGVAFGLLSGLSFATYNILTKIEMQRGCQPLTATMYSSLFMSVVSVFFLRPAQMISATAQRPFMLILLILCLGALTFVTPYFLYTLSLRALPAGTASALSIIEPMSATVFGVIIYRERLDIFAAIGIVLILGAVFLLSKSESDIK